MILRKISQHFSISLLVSIFSVLASLKKASHLLNSNLYFLPLELRDSFSKLIDEEIRNQKENQNGSIIAKMNALVDQEIIETHEASAAGVSIVTSKRICCLIPNLRVLRKYRG